MPRVTTLTILCRRLPGDAAIVMLAAVGTAVGASPKPSLPWNCSRAIPHVACCFCVISNLAVSKAHQKLYHCLTGMSCLHGMSQQWFISASIKWNIRPAHLQLVRCLLNMSTMLVGLHAPPAKSQHPCNVSQHLADCLWATSVFIR